jgi:ribonuclease R
VYCHATSPLRRAADLLTQRAVVAHLDGRAAPFTAAEAAGFCERLTVVIAQARASDGASARTRAHEIARAILDQGANYPRMSSDRFFMLVKRATKEGIASPGFLGEVARRADADLLEMRDLYHLLLLPVGGEWSAAKQACLAQVARRPEHAVSLVAMHAATRGVAAPVYRYESAGPAHGPVFGAAGRVSAGDGTVVAGASRLAASKKDAQAQAALSVLAELAGVLDPSRDLVVPAQQPAGVCSVAGDDPMQTLNHARQTGRLADVQWVVGVGDARDGRPVFHALLTARRPDGTAVECRGSAGTKKAAKAAAAAKFDGEKD